MGDSMKANKKQLLGPLGCLSHSHGLITLHLFSIVLLAGLLLAVLVQDSLCRPCPWEWTLFSGKCYYFSKSHRNWSDSFAACQEVEAQLVIVESDEEQVCLVGFLIEYWKHILEHVWRLHLQTVSNSATGYRCGRDSDHWSMCQVSFKTFLHVISKDNGSAWIGLSDPKQNGTWQWVDGSPMSDR